MFPNSIYFLPNSKSKSINNIEYFENQYIVQEMNNDDPVLKYIFYINDNVQNEVEHSLHTDDNNANYNDDKLYPVALL